MRMISLLITLGIVAYLIVTQFGAGQGENQHEVAVRAEQKAQAVEGQVQAQFDQQSAALQHMENGEPASGESAEQ